MTIQLAKTRPGADCGSDYQLLIVKFRFKLKKVEKITRPFRYDLNTSICPLPPSPVHFTAGMGCQAAVGAGWR